MQLVTFDRKIYFDTAKPMFGSYNQEQVDGQEFLLAGWEKHPASEDLRHFAYMLATTKHETASTMMPIEEYGKGSGAEYGKKDPKTGHAYYGRGFVQLTWADNYKKATTELGLEDGDDLYLHADQALDPIIACQIMFKGMEEGWFRKSKDGKAQTLIRYFSATRDDPYEAREIINGDKTKVPTWSNGVSIGNLIKGYHQKFLVALQKSAILVPSEPEPELPLEPVDPEERVVSVVITAPPGVRVDVQIVQ